MPDETTRLVPMTRAQRDALDLRAPTFPPMHQRAAIRELVAAFDAAPTGSILVDADDLREALKHAPPGTPEEQVNRWYVARANLRAALDAHHANTEHTP